MGLELDANRPDLDAIVTWMRKRGVIALKVGETAVTLNSMQEPSEARTEEQPSKDEVRQRSRQERAENFYSGGNPVPR